jgi:hypothetical protein
MDRPDQPAINHAYDRKTRPQDQLFADQDQLQVSRCIRA